MSLMFDQKTFLRTQNSVRISTVGRVIEVSLYKGVKTYNCFNLRFNQLLLLYWGLNDTL